ncbi:MAG: DapH/DapD/GlmU-related protein [Candidatus Bathyarchaeota archaeon]
MKKQTKDVFKGSENFFGKVILGKDVWVGLNTVIYGPCRVGDKTFIGDGVVIGFPTRGEIKVLMENNDFKKFLKVKGLVKIGLSNVIRSGTIIYSNVYLGDNVEVGHNTLIRENVRVGDKTLVGSNVTIDGNCRIGSNVSIQTGVYISAYTTIESNVFLGPYAVLLNDKYMRKKPYKLRGPRICEGACIGGNSIIMPSITVGGEAIVGAGSIVTKNVKSKSIVAGVPAREIGKVT